MTGDTHDQPAEQTEEQQLQRLTDFLHRLGPEGDVGQAMLRDPQHALEILTERVPIEEIRGFFYGAADASRHVLGTITTCLPGLTRKPPNVGSAGLGPAVDPPAHEGIQPH
jgi:hypothetical protein